MPSAAGETSTPKQEVPLALGPVDFSVLTESEAKWRDLVPFLKERGYQLRARFQPDWVPSWKGRVDVSPVEQEDCLGLLNPNMVDAVRISDGEMLFLKRISRATHPYEQEIATMFSLDSAKSDPRNHCIPVIEVLEVPGSPDDSILVMPLLRLFWHPKFQTVGEVLEFFRQVFEGLQFMHERHVAHRDCMDLNIMMDPRPLFPKMFHPRSIYDSRDFKGSPPYSRWRTKHPVKYYLIDFGLSRRYDEGDTSPLEDPIEGGDRTVPEFRNQGPCNPFPTDIYYIGNMIRERFFDKLVDSGLDFLRPLVNDMVQDSPEKRPTIDEVVTRFDELCRSLPWRALWARVVYKDDEETPEQTARKNRWHAISVAFDILCLRRAMPKPPRKPLHTFTL